MIALCATLCGADGCVDMEEFGKSKERFLREFLSLPHGVPAHDTFSRIFRALDPARFVACFQPFVQRFAEAHHGVVAVDGKTLRHSFDRAAAASALHLVSAWASEQRLVPATAIRTAGSSRSASASASSAVTRCPASTAASTSCASVDFFRASFSASFQATSPPRRCH